MFQFLSLCYYFMQFCCCSTSIFYVYTGEENSRVQAHIDRDEFSAHILTDETEYNVEVTISTLSYALHDMFTFFFMFSPFCIVPFSICFISVILIYILH